jgi:Helix-turn-helix family
MDSATLSARARKLGSVLEPLTGQVYFSPECHENYVKLGFDPSPGKAKGVALPDGPAYFTSRGSVMGQVAGEVVAAAFGVFNPEVVVPMVTLGWTRTDAPTICHARDDGGIAQLERILGKEPEGIDRVNELLERAVEPLRPEGRPLYSGLRSQELPESKMGTMWRRGDMLREYRGDSHVTSWVSAGMTATEIGLLTELYWGLPMRTYSRTRAWTDSQFDTATEALKGRGLIDDTGFTAEGREARELIETMTDAQMAPAIRALGDDIDELFEILEPWGARVRECFGYLSSGPHDLARKASSFAS